MRIRVIDVAHKATKDIDEAKSVDAKELDRLAKRCVLASDQALGNSISQFSDFHRHHLSTIFDSLGQTHETIRDVLRHGSNSPISADALPIARLQIEMVYSLCLMIEDPQAIDWYLKHSWRQTYVQYLVEETERQNLP